MGYYEFVTNRFQNWSPLALAILIDILMIIPFVDFLFTIPLQWLLWTKVEDNEFLAYINMSYDLVADFAIPFVGDLVPLNTIFVICIMIVDRIKQRL